MQLLGIKVGNGLGLGKCVIIDSKLPNLNQEVCENKEEELKKVSNAIDEAIIDYQNIIATLEDEDLKSLTEFNKNVLISPSIKKDMENIINNKNCFGDVAIDHYFNEKIKQLENLDNKYLNERAKDVKDIRYKVLAKYYKIKEFNPNNLTEDVILVSHEMTANVLLTDNIAHIKGIVSELGGKTSHIGILTTSLGIPSVFGIDIKNLKNDELIFIDGNKGFVENNLNNDKIKIIKDKIQVELELKKELDDIKEAKTTDGYIFDVCSNTGDLTELERLDSIPLDGVGLFRTEFLYLNKTTPPTEDYLFEVYKKFVEKLNHKQMIIRTLDIGGDKKCPYIDIKDEANPFLGYRAIRYCLDHKDFFKTSLRAILRASAFGNIAIMYPMISSIEEIRQANLILEETKEELTKENIKFNKDIKVGVMVEIPAIAAMADMVIPEVDFFSIGTNDLVQYTTAVDRGNTTISKLYQWFNPGVIRLIKNTIEATKKYDNKFVGMCGEMSADPLGIILLVGLGLDEFSVNMNMVKRTKKYISLLNKKETENFVKTLFDLKTVKEIEDKLNEFAKLKYGKYY